MIWKWLGALLLFPVQMVYLVVKAAVYLVLPPRLRDLSRENVLVTGGGRGIGRHLAREFARRGARKVSREGRGSAHLLLCQGTLFPHLWVGLVGSLGKAERGSHFAELNHYISYISEVAHSSFLPFPTPSTTKAFLPRMLELQNGHIVCLNSVLALSAIPGAIDYCTSKASSFAFMESLTLGLLDCPGVNATTVLPFHTSTEMFQGMRIRFPSLFPPLKPETVARRTVEAVQMNQSFLLLPWTMNVLVILKSILPQAALEEIHKFSGSYTCMNTFKGRT
ncbi:DHRS3 reductase, partial [Certhia familiaris]|nr:DHRS3 reductase [Certhia familiaris]